MSVRLFSPNCSPPFVKICILSSPIKFYRTVAFIEFPAGCFRVDPRASCKGLAISHCGFGNEISPAPCAQELGSRTYLTYPAIQLGLIDACRKVE